MSRHVPLLTEVYLRAWALDDPRVLSALRAENQPAHTFATRAVTQRAIDAGHPVLDLDDRRRAATAAMRRLEAADWTWTGGRNHHLFVGNVRYESRSRGPATVDVYETDDQFVSIFDE